MTSRVIIPFNNNPSSVSVKTTSYTIPAGKYAQVYIECDSGGIFTINGNNAVVTASFINVDVQNVTSASVSYTVPTGYRFIGSIASTGATNWDLSGNYTPNTSSSTFLGINLGAGGAIVSAAVSGEKCINGVAIPSNATNRQATFWVNSGTVISGTGNWKAVVEEFYSIS